MGRRFKKFKTSHRCKKVNNTTKIENKRIIGEISLRRVYIYGSNSNLIKPLTIYSLAPFDLYDKKIKEYIKHELNIFKNYTNNNLYRDQW